MTKVIHLPSPRAGTRNAPGVHASAFTTTPAHSASPIERQQAIENALSMALFFIRQPDNSVANVWAATARTNRALTLLKQASQGNAPVSTANTMGRA